MKVRVVFRADRRETAVRQHHISFEQVVDREATAAGQVADASPQSEPANAGRGDGPCRYGEAVDMGRVIHLTPGAAATHPDRLVLGLDAHVLDPRQIDYQPVVADA